MTNIEAIMLANISSYKPDENINIQELVFNYHISLSDPEFNRSDSIDLLLSVAVLAEVDMKK